MPCTIGNMTIRDNMAELSLHEGLGLYERIARYARHNNVGVRRPPTHGPAPIRPARSHLQPARARVIGSRPMGCGV
jgi:hypothetical protein